jgi:hypothetical protein
MPIERKRGAFSTEELKFVEDNLNILTAEQIGIKINRNTEVVAKHMEKIGDKKNYTLVKEHHKEAANELKTKPYWDELKKQYTERELTLYLYHWAGYLDQFGGDVTHSEETQICNTIDLVILMHRTLI